MLEQGNAGNERRINMTFREKLAQEHPDCVGGRYDGGCRLCPYIYGYENLENLLPVCRKLKGNCEACWDREIPETEGTEKMKLSDIRDGYLLEIEHNGNRYYATVIHNKNDDLGFCCPNKAYGPVSILKENLECDATRIVAIYGRASNQNMMDNSPEGRKLIWRRRKRLMTISEIEKALGCEVEIVPEPQNPGNAKNR